MEITLNLAWLALAVWMYCLWLRHAAREGAGLRAQFVALVVIVLILLPAISITDDLMAVQNVAETDRGPRKHQVRANADAEQVTAPVSSLNILASLSQGFSQTAVPLSLPAPRVVIPALACIRNRPPPLV